MFPFDDVIMLANMDEYQQVTENITTTIYNKTKLCAIFLGYIVHGICVDRNSMGGFFHGSLLLKCFKYGLDMDKWLYF